MEEGREREDFLAEEERERRGVFPSAVSIPRECVAEWRVGRGRRGGRKKEGRRKERW